MGAVPHSAKAVALLARIDWPAMEFGKKCRRCVMNHIRVGMVPLVCSHSSGLLRKSRSREQRYNPKSRYVSVNVLGMRR